MRHKPLDLLPGRFADSLGAAELDRIGHLSRLSPLQTVSTLDSHAIQPLKADPTQGERVLDARDILLF